MIIIKSEVSTFPVVIIFFCGCVPEMFVTLYSVTYCIYVPGNPGICFHYYCAVYDECKYSNTFWLADRTRLFVQYTISLSSLCKLIWRHWTYKMPVRYILSSVWVRLSIFSPLSIIQYVGLYVFSLPISLVMIEIIYILCFIIIHKSEVWTITHCLGLGHETMVSAACLSIFLPNINNCEYFRLNRFDTVSCARSSVNLQLRFKITNFKMLYAPTLDFTVQTVHFSFSSSVWYIHSRPLSYSTLYRTDIRTWRKAPFMTGNVWRAMLLIHHSIRPHWFIITQLSNVLSLFLTW